MPELRRALVFLAVIGGCADRAPSSAPPDDAGTPPVEAAAPTTDATGPDADAARPCGDKDGLPSSVTANGRTFSAGATTLSVLADGVVRLRYGQAAVRRSYAMVASPEDVLVRTGIRGDAELVVCTPSLEVSVRTSDGRVRAIDTSSGTVVLEDPDGGAYFRAQATPKGGTTPVDVVGVARPAAADERFYGFGLKTGAALDRRGSVLEMWTTDAYDDTVKGFRPDADPVYEAIPFTLGLRSGVAYGLLTDVLHRVRIDLASTDPVVVRTTSFGDAIEQVLFAGPRMRDVLSRYTWATGRAPLPPSWALGFQQSRWEDPCDALPADRPMCSDAQIRQLAQKFRDEKIPVDGLWLDIQHMDGFRSFTYDKARFADPAGLVAALAAKGFATTVIVDPGIKVDPAWDVYAAGLAGKRFLADADGGAWQGTVWPGLAAFPDFSDPAARGWWGDLAATEAARGVRGVWIDMNEPSEFTLGTVPSTLAAAGDGTPTTMAEIHNAYGLLEARATYEGMKKGAPNARPFVLSRAAAAGSQRYAAVWTGDAPSTWTTLGMTLAQLMNLGLSGMAIAGSDVGGYSGRAESTGELFARWMAVGAISPFFRAHAEKDARRQEPWAFGADVEDAVRALVGVRYALLPYLYSTVAETARSGAPVLRPLVYEFEGDLGSRAIADEAMLGPSILAAPIVAQGATSRSVYLPPGRWFDAFGGAAFDGGRVISVSTAPDALPLAALPLFVREGAIVPRADVRQWTGERAADPIYLDAWPGDAPSSFVLYDDDGASFDHESGRFARTTYTAQRTATGARVAAAAREGSFAPAKRSLVVRVMPVDHAVTSATLDGAPVPFTWDANDRAALVTIDDRAPFELVLAFDPTRAPEPTRVKVPVKVALPPGTPETTPIAIAVSTSGWAHLPLTRAPGATVATGEIDAPRGAWLLFQVTRGSWATVEKGPGCVEIQNRGAPAGAHPGIDVTVRAWADACP